MVEEPNGKFDSPAFVTNRTRQAERGTSSRRRATVVWGIGLDGEANRKSVRGCTMKVAYGLGLVAGLLLLGTPAHAGLTPIEEATEVMMESQGLQATAIGFRLGSDDASPLHFTSAVGTTAFSYALESGTTYQGLSATWSTTGSRDGTTGIWSWVTTSHIGSDDFSSTGSGGPFTGVDPPMSIELPLLGETLFSNITYEKKGGVVTSKGTVTIKDGTGKVLRTVQSTDKLQTEGLYKGQWEWKTGHITDQKEGAKEYRIGGFGFSLLPDGGAGTFETRISPAPEPSSLLLAGLGGLSLFAARFCRTATQRKQLPV
jgi:hypothetical protein